MTIFPPSSCLAAARQEEGGNIVISSVYDKKEHYNTLEWTIYANGIVRMQVNYFPEAYFTSFIGVNFSYPESRIKEVTYMGDGPTQCMDRTG